MSVTTVESLLRSLRLSTAANELSRGTRRIKVQCFSKLGDKLTPKGTG